MRKIGLIVIVSLVVLAGLGVAYAGWSDVVDIRTDVTIASVSADFQQVAASDEAISVTGQPGQTLTLSINDAYPGCLGSAACTIKNTGELPIKVDTVTTVVTPLSAGGVAEDVAVTFSGVLNSAAHTPIDPGAEIAGAIFLQINGQRATPASYDLAVTVKLSQFNSLSDPSNDWSQFLYIEGTINTLAESLALNSASPVSPEGVAFRQVVSNDPSDPVTFDPTSTGIWNWSSGQTLNIDSWAGERSATYTSSHTLITGGLGSQTLNIALTSFAGPEQTGCSSAGCTVFNNTPSAIRITGVTVSCSTDALTAATHGVLAADSIIPANREMLGWIDFDWQSSLSGTCTVAIAYEFAE
jgi:hypothetical protein